MSWSSEDLVKAGWTLHEEPAMEMVDEMPSRYFTRPDILDSEGSLYRFGFYAAVRTEKVRRQALEEAAELADKAGRTWERLNLHVNARAVFSVAEGIRALAKEKS